MWPARPDDPFALRLDNQLALMAQVQVLQAALAGRMESLESGMLALLGQHQG